MKLAGASLVTLGMIFSFVFFVIALVMLYTDSMNIWVVMGLTVLVNFVL